MGDRLANGDSEDSYRDAVSWAKRREINGKTRTKACWTFRWNVGFEDGTVGTPVTSSSRVLRAVADYSDEVKD